MNTLLKVRPSFIEMRQQYVIVDKPRREARAKVAKEVATLVFCYLFGIVMTATLLGLIQLAFVLSH